MSKKGKRGLLAVSFGTSVSRTREKTIDAIERDLQQAFPKYRLYRAWTSKIIVKKLRERDNVRIDTVTEAVKRMLAEGITELLVQPTHVLGGVENDKMTEEVLAFEKYFEKAAFGAPLLASGEDMRRAVRAVMEEYGIFEKEEALVFMGHGTSHDANAVYAALNDMFKEMGFPNVFMGTVEAHPSLERLLSQVRSYGARRVTLAPFMVVAGDHARNDMSGENKDSWRSRFEEAGFEVNCVLKGLGEYEGIRRMYVEHAGRAAEILG